MPEFLFAPVPHDEAIDFIASKPVVSRDVFDRLLPELQARAFTITGIESANVLQNARDIVATLPAGRPWDTVKRELAALISPYLGDKESALAKAELLLRVHGHEAYAAAADRVARRQEPLFPYWQYQTMGDSKVRASHRALDGLVLPANSPFWTTHNPPWEWGCRCIKIPISDGDRAEIAQRTPELVLDPARLRKVETGNVIERFDLAKGTREFVDVAPSGKFRFDPDDLTLGVHDLRARYDAATWSAFEQWARRTEIPGQSRTVWDWISGEEGAPNIGPAFPAEPAPTPIEKKEQAIIENKTESAHIFAPDGGALLFSKRGSRSQVSFSSSEVQQMKDFILTHNHPQGSAFSYADIEMAFHADLAEIRAIGRAADGRGFLYSLRRPENGWPSAELRSIIDTYKATLSRLVSELDAAIRRGEMTNAEARTRLTHEIMQELAAKYPEAIRYERTEITTI